MDLGGSFLDPVGGKCDNSTKTDVINSSIHLLLRQLVDTENPFSPSKSGRSRQLVQQIKTAIKKVDPKSVDPTCYNELHTVLLMRLGFTMSTLPSCSNGSLTMSGVEKETGEQILLLLQCLRLLYKFFPWFTHLVNEGELRESLSILLQIFEGVDVTKQFEVNINVQKCSNSSLHLMAEVALECWNIIELVVDKLANKGETLAAYETQLEEILESLVRYIGHDSVLPNTFKVDTPRLVELVKKIQHMPLSGRATKKATISLMIVTKLLESAENNAEINHSLLFSEISQKQDRIYLWKCLTYFPDHPRARATLKDSSVIREVQEIIFPDMNGSYGTFDSKSGGLVVDAVECLCHVAQTCLVSRECKAMLQLLVRVIMVAPNTVCRRKALASLHSLLSTNDGMKALLGIEVVTDLLESISVGEVACDENSMLSFAKIMKRSTIYMISESLVGPRMQPLWDALFAHLGDMLLSDNRTIVLLAVDAINHVSQNCKALLRHIVQSRPDAIPSLASAALNDVSSVIITHKVVNIFSHIIDGNDGTQVVSLAREPRAMEALVQSASQHTTSEATSDARKLAISIILKLSTNVCNRRILAKQIGLIPALIRYTRSQGMEQHHSDDGLLPSREELKKQILVLAQAL